VGIIYFDFAKAFNSVPDTRLLTKLKLYGLTENLLRWLESYLVGRKQRVVINGETSAWCDVLSDVPHWSPTVQYLCKLHAYSVNSSVL